MVFFESVELIRCAGVCSELNISVACNFTPESTSTVDSVTPFSQYDIII